MLYGSEIAPPIGDYGIIGDCRSAALISKHGSLDWLCWPWFDSPSIFAALLDLDKGGFWRIAPAGEYTSTRRYLPGTNVLETEFQTPSGVLRLTDCMPVYDAAYERAYTVPDREILRVVECVSGEVQLDAAFCPRPKHGDRHCRVVHHKALGIRVEFIGGALWSRSDLDWQLSGNDACCQSALHAGERKYCSLVLMEHDPAILSPLGSWSDTALDQTTAWWERWSRRCEYQGPLRENVVRSALALKLLNFAPSGALVASPATSLPERIGGDLNWDYRYCWLRDASMTVTALFGLGYHEEAEAFIEWLLHSTNRTQPRLLVMYSVYGKRIRKERALNHWTDIAVLVQFEWATARVASCSWMCMVKSSQRRHSSTNSTRKSTARARAFFAELESTWTSTGVSQTKASGNQERRINITPIPNLCAGWRWTDSLSFAKTVCCTNSILKK